MNFVFNIAKVKPVKVKKEKIENVKFCICVKANDTFYAKVRLADKTYDICEFTAKSFDIEGRKEVFREDVMKGKPAIIMWLRDIFEILHNQGVGTYTPFRKNGVYSGTYYKIAGKCYFDIKDYVGYLDKNGQLVIWNDKYKLENVKI